MTVNDEVASEDLIRTMSPAQIEKFIPQKKFEQLVEDHPNIVDDNCTICIDFLKNGQKLRCVPLCGHVFHSDCLLNWLHVTEVCPNCKNEISIYTLRAYYDSMKQTRKDKDKKDPKRDEPKLRPDTRGRPGHNLAGSTTEIVFSRLNNPNPSNQSRLHSWTGADISRNPRSRVEIEDSAGKDDGIEELKLEDAEALSPQLGLEQAPGQREQP